MPIFVFVIICSVAIFSVVALILIQPFTAETTKTELEELIEYHVKSFELFVMPKHRIAVERFHFMIKNSPPLEMPVKSQKSEVEGYFNEISIEVVESNTNNSNSRKPALSIEKIELDYSPEKKTKRPIRHNSVSWEHANLHTQFLDRHEEVYRLAEHHPKVKASVQTHSLHTAVFSLRTLRYMILLYTINCKYSYLISVDFPLTIMNLMKPFSLYHISSLDEKLIFWLSVCYSLVNGSGRSIFGILYDKYGLLILRIAVCVELCISSSIFFVSETSWLFFLLIVILAMIYSCSACIIPASITKVYGVEFSSQVFGCSAAFTGFASLTAPILSKMLGLSKSADDHIYLILFEVGAGLNVIAIILLFTMNEDPFDYDKDHRKKVEEMIKLYEKKLNSNNSSKEISDKKYEPPQREQHNHYNEDIDRSLQVGPHKGFDL